jgi:hypothetical protein
MYSRMSGFPRGCFWGLVITGESIARSSPRANERIVLISGNDWKPYSLMKRVLTLS